MVMTVEGTVTISQRVGEVVGSNPTGYVSIASRSFRGGAALAVDVLRAWGECGGARLVVYMERECSYEYS